MTATRRERLKKINITIPITPVAWQRPKTSIINGWVHHYSPAKTKNYEKAIADYYKQATRGFRFDKDEPICVNLVFGMPIPQSTPKSRREAMREGVIRHTKRPDVDNLAKSVLDALNGVAWEDDSQIVRLSVSKQYRETPDVYIYIHESVD